jgi:hypothetical protein
MTARCDKVDRVPVTDWARFLSDHLSGEATAALHVRQGAGFMIMGADGAKREIEQGELLFVPISPEIRMPLSIATRRSKSTSLACRMMLAEVLQGAQRARAGTR